MNNNERKEEEVVLLEEWVWEGGKLREQLAETTQRRINTLVDQKRLEEHKLNLFNEFLSNL